MISNSGNSTGENDNSGLEKLCFPSKLPPYFPRDGFLNLLRTSLSLNKNDKLRILLELPTLSTKQILELYETFAQERTQIDAAVQHGHSDDVNRLAIQKTQTTQDWEEVVQRWQVLSKRPLDAPFDCHNLLTPKSLHALLDAHVVGQTHVTKELATLVYHHMLDYHLCVESDTSIPKITRPVLLAGYTGTGKTFTIQKISAFAELPFIHVNTASMVSEGIVGMSINDIGRDILRKAEDDIKRAEHAIVFLDEFDKTMCESHYGSSVVYQLLRVIEGSEFTISPKPWDDSESKPKVSSLRTSSMLFILGGAFQKLLESKQKPGIGFRDGHPETECSFSRQDLVKMGFPKELAGRINSILTLNPLNEEDYYTILTESDSSPLNEYLQLIRCYGDEVHIPDEALREIARQAAETGLGTRALHRIVYGVFRDILYEAPNPIVQSFVINREKVLDVVEGDFI